MPKLRDGEGRKNLVAERVKKLRAVNKLSQRALAHQLQLKGNDIDKNVITRIESNQRYVSDFEVRALAEIFHVTYEYLLDGKEELGQDEE